MHHQQPDLLLSLLREEAGLDDHWLVREGALSEDLEESRLGHVNDWDLAPSLNLLLLVLGASLGGDKSPETVDVDDWAEVHVLGLVEVTHTDLTEVTRVIFVEVNAMVMLTTSVTASTRVLAVLSNTTLTVGHSSTQFAA